MVRRATRLLGLTLALGAAYAVLGAVTAFAAVPPTGMVCTNGTAGPNFTLRATSGQIDTPDANTVLMWSYANAAPGSLPFQLPSPVLCVNQGDVVTITLNNSLSEPTSIVFPGQTGVTSTGTAGLFTNEAPAGGSATYTFTASQPGTYLYESGTSPEKQVEMGLYGALVVRPTGHPNWAYGNATTQFNPAREYLVLIHDIDPALHHQVELGLPYDFPALHFRYWTVNGRMFPDTIANNGVSWLASEPYGSLVRVKPYDPVLNPLPALVRIVNAGLANHPFHPHGFHLRTIARDGRMILTPSGGDASTEHFGDTVAAGSAQDALFTYVDKDKFCSGTSCTASGYGAENPIPVTLPNYLNLRFKDSQTYYSGSPYLGVKGLLPVGVVSYNVCGEFYFPWHSHALNEFVNYDVPFGGLATLLRVDPQPGCTAFPTLTKIIPTPPNTTPVSGSLGGGAYGNLSLDDALYYSVKSTATAIGPAPNTYKADWYGGFSGVATGASNLTATFKGKCNVADCTQNVYIWNWRTKLWVQLDSRTVGTSDVTVASVAVPASPAGKWSDYVGTGAQIGQVQVRVYNSRAAGIFTESGNFMKLVYDAP
jgi:hypothetical protein